MASIHKFLLFSLALLLFASPFLQVARCQSDSDDAVDNIEESSDIGIVGDDAQDFGDGTFSSAPGIDTISVFPKNSARLITAGEESELLVGVKNDGDSSLNVIAIRASIHLPFDHRLLVQNLTTQGFNNGSVPASAQATFPYLFAVSKYMQPGNFPKMEGPSTPANRRDPYEVLSVSRDSTDQEIKTAYRKLALKYHPDKNASNPEASELFKEVAYSYSILSDPEKRRQYDSAGFEALDADSMDMEIDLSNLGTVNTMFAALFSKLGVPIKTTISANVLEEALNGTVTVRPLPIGTSVSGKVEKQCAHFFGVTINEQQAESGIVIRVTSTAQSKFKLLYFEQDVNGGYGLALQEDSEKTGKVTSAGMYFLHFQVYRMDSTVNALAMAKDPEGAFFKRLEGLQPCEVSELKAGTHIFAVYGDNFFKTASYTIEAVCAKSYEDTTQKLKDVEAQILRKRNELRQFEAEYRKALARYQEVTDRYTKEKQSVDELLKQRDSIHSSFTIVKSTNVSGNGSNFSNGSSSKMTGEESPSEDGGSDGKDKSGKKKWFNLNIRGSDKRLG